MTYRSDSSALKALILSFSSVIALAAAGCAETAAPSVSKSLPSGISHVQTYSPETDNPGIGFEKYELDNGLTVILHKDRSDPLVHIDVRYHVGSNREEPGRSGFGHLFEHMMFQGSAHVGDDEHFKIVSEAGGSANGEITDDWTNYYQTVPSNELEPMLWLEADRMGFLLADITQEKFETQRDAVKNERDQKFDNVPYGVVMERIGEAMYPHGHPYSWHRIGYVDDLDAATLDDVTAFFQDWYGPNNAVLTIGGSFDRETTLGWISKYFGSIPSGPEVAPLSIPTITLPSDRYISMEDNIELPLLRIDYPLDLIAYGQDEAALDVWSILAGTRKSSTLQKVLVESGLTENVVVQNFCRELSCFMTIEVLMRSNEEFSFADAEALIEKTLQDMMSNPLDDVDVQSVITGITSDKLYDLETVHEKVDYISVHETYLGQPDYFEDDMQRYMSVTPDDIAKAYTQHIKDASAVITRVVPNGRTDLIIPEDNYVYPGRKIPSLDRISRPEWQAPEDDFDRSVKPEPGPVEKTRLPSFTKFNLANTVPVFLTQSDEAPITTIEILMDIGRKDDPIDRIGMAKLMTAMLEESSLYTPAHELSEHLNSLGASLNISVGESLSALRLKTPSRHAEQSMMIVAEHLLAPKFDPEEFETAKRQAISNAQSSLKRPSYLASSLFNRLVYGSDNAFAYPSAGLPETLEAISLDDLKTFYRTHYTADRIQILSASDLDKSELTQVLSPLKDTEVAPDRSFTVEPFPVISKPVIYFVDKPGATQSEIRVGRAGSAFDHDDAHYKARVMNYMFGADFNSRLNSNLRENKGYTYGIHSRVSANGDYGRFRIDTGVRTDATVDALREIIAEMEKMADTGLRAGELAFTKAYFTKSNALNFESHAQKIFLLSRLALYDLDQNYLDEQAEALRSMTVDTLNEKSRSIFNIERQIIVIVGSKADVFDGLSSLGYPVIEVDETGTPCSSMD
ncbi:peptidase M16 [Algimonas ampicilliniresistens]|uniref:Peptidase M16 n=1 Tax=Algimonas ampicilliniresistens TaxID=1298735 RepID=A0ABQ5VC34_9PROT|nr:pitrilysin family protein [Algimonas ampicilliniresistens]GLQ24625.1 peptidase M16 [Algimonas ampicilliniresistens]